MSAVSTSAHADLKGRIGDDVEGEVETVYSDIKEEVSGVVRDKVRCWLRGNCSTDESEAYSEPSPASDVSSPPPERVQPRARTTDGRWTRDITVKLFGNIDWMDSPVEVAKKLAARPDVVSVNVGRIVRERGGQFSREEVIGEWSRETHMETGLDRAFAPRAPTVSAKLRTSDDDLSVRVHFAATPGMILNDKKLLTASNPNYLGAVVSKISIEGRMSVAACDSILSKIERDYRVNRVGHKNGDQRVRFSDEYSAVAGIRNWNGADDRARCAVEYEAIKHAERLNAGFYEWHLAESERRRELKADRVRTSGRPSVVANDF